jgi:hypothetical protein
LLEGEAGIHATWVGRISIRNHTTRSFRSFEESEITLFRRTFGRARSPSWCSLRWGLNDRLDKSPRVRNPAVRTTIAVASPTRPAAPAWPCVLRRPIAQAQVRKQQLLSLQVLPELLASLSHFLFYLPAMTSPSRHDRPPDKDGEENCGGLRGPSEPRSTPP